MLAAVHVIRVDLNVRYSAKLFRFFQIDAVCLLSAAKLKSLSIYGPIEVHSVSS